jgi:preprotein translocase subunit SecD
MQRFRLQQVSCLAALALGAGVLWSAGPSRAQSVATPGPGCLSFHQVHPEVHAPAALQTRVPEGFRIYLVAHSDRPEQGLVLREAPFLNGGDLTDAETSVDLDTRQPLLILRFNETGRARLAGFTQAHVGHAIAIVVDGRVISAPLLREPILDGLAQIGGSLTPKDAQELVSKLKARTCASAR